MKICTVIFGKTPSKLESLGHIAHTEGANLLEIRLDLCHPDLQFSQLHILPLPTVITNRSKEEGGYAPKGTAKHDIDTFLKSGFDYVDIEIPSLEKTQQIPSREKGEIVFSKHWLSPPNLKTMEKLVSTFGEHGIVKLIPTAGKLEDNLSVLEFVKQQNAKGFRVISFCMGSLGLISRILSPLVGGMWTYASLEDPVASGQIQTSLLRRLYDDYLG